MKKVILSGMALVVLFGCCTPMDKWEGEKVVLVVFGQYSPVFEALWKGYWVSYCNVSYHFLETAGLDGEAVMKRIRGIDPDLIFVADGCSLEKVKGVADIPIVYALAPGRHESVSDRPNIIGLPLRTPPWKKLKTIRALMPEVKRIGLVYMESNATIVEKIERTTSGSGVRLLSKRLAKRADFPDALREMEGKIDLFWMIPCVDTFTRSSIDELMDFSARSRTPVFTFSEYYVARGALFSSDVDVVDIGRQCREISLKILAGADPRTLKPVEPEKEVLAVSISTELTMSLDLNQEMVYKMKAYAGRKRWW